MSHELTIDEYGNFDFDPHLDHFERARVPVGQQVAIEPHVLFERALLGVGAEVALFERQASGLRRIAIVGVELSWHERSVRIEIAVDPSSGPSDVAKRHEPLIEDVYSVYHISSLSVVVVRSLRLSAESLAQSGDRVVRRGGRRRAFGLPRNTVALRGPALLARPCAHRAPGWADVQSQMVLRKYSAESVHAALHGAPSVDARRIDRPLELDVLVEVLVQWPAVVVAEHFEALP